MPILPDALIAMIRERIADPNRRNAHPPAWVVGSTNDPQQVSDFLNRSGEGDDPLRGIFAQRASWGLPPARMHLIQYPDGSRGASSDSGEYPLAPPASEADLAALEARIGRPMPEDLRQMFGIADGGWGPGDAFTPDYGPGIMSIERLLQEWADLERRGPGYVGESAWPANLLPFADTGGILSYDLATGTIVQFDDHWYDHDKAIEEAFEPSHASLSDFLQQWMMEEAG
ncbi:MAG: SMI1/KNR4 family protein [Sphingopyxis sp.]|nr:SMI1/KNR4 family protein [Sphingopyxis sp.]